MGELQNPRHERFAQELAAGNTADAAYEAAGYRKHRGNAARLSANERVKDRVREIQAVDAERAAVTVQSLIDEAEQARIKAMDTPNGAGRRSERDYGEGARKDRPPQHWGAKDRGRKNAVENKTDKGTREALRANALRVDGIGGIFRTQ